MSIDYQARPVPFTPILAPYATKAAESRGRLVPEQPSASRSAFQRDRDRIVHSGAFRKLRNKTQVFIESEGDYYRTRLTHSLEVAQIARSVARALGLDEDLAEAVALAHDLGHTCFGHAGEDGLADAMKDYGGFSHNEQTFRILTQLENRYARFDGLNLTWETLEGVVKHNGPVTGKHLRPSLLAYNAKWDLELGTHAGAEAQVAAIADDIAYNTHDVDDGHRAGFFRMEDLNELPLFGPALRKARDSYPNVARDRIMHEAVREVIGLMVGDLLATTRKMIEELRPRSADEVRGALQPLVALSTEMTAHLNAVRHFLWKRVYRHNRINRVCVKARQIVGELFTFFMAHEECLPGSWSEAVRGCDTDQAARARVVADYIAGMTDRFAAQEHRKLFSSEMIG